MSEVRRWRRFSIVILGVSLIGGCWRPEKNMEQFKEGVLKEDLYSMRNAVDQYATDKGRLPASLDDLVRAGYLHDIPEDPFTNSRWTWTVIYEEKGPVDTPVVSPKKDPETRGIADVHSGSDQTSSEGTPYSTW